jgi:hypothetical protein
MKIALTIPCTSKGRPEWKSMKDTYMYNLTLKTFLLIQDKEHEYHFYIGFDYDDRIFSDKEEQRVIIEFSTVFTNIHFHFIKLNVEKGFVTKMWNELYQKAYNDKCDYFYQCGDDINFKTRGWVNDSIKALLCNNNIGISGPINNNNRILTQAMFSRKHMDIFGFMFPEEIKNWCCDDWYNEIYKPNHFFPLKKHYCSNDGGVPRYHINGDKKFMVENTNKKLQELRNITSIMAKNHRQLIDNFIIKNKND